jgi:transcriptional regulator NrdR family protein
MPNEMNHVPAKRVETEPPTVVDDHGEKHPSAEEKLQRSADRAAHKAAKTEQNYDTDHSQFTNIGPR